MEALSPKKLLTEFAGTGLLIFTIGVSVPVSGALAPLAIGVALSSLVYCCGVVSGGHLNPAVSLGVMICQKQKPIETLLYWLAQIFGATVFGWLAEMALGSTYPVIGHPQVANGAIGEALVCEFLITFALVYTVLHVAAHEKAKGNSYFGLAIGFTVLSGAVSVGGISGGAFNPAVSILTFCYAPWLGQQNNVWVWCVGPLLGGACAGAIFGILHPDQIKPGAQTVEWKKYVIEFIGTFYLCFTVAMAVPQGSILTALAIGSILMCQVYAGGAHSGAAYNPAVTLAVFIQGGLDAMTAGIYVAIQLVAGLVAGGVASFLLQAIDKTPGYPGLHKNQEGVQDATEIQGLIAEFVATFFLCTVVLNTACSNDDSQGKSYFGFAIGMTVTAMAYSVGGISGGALNPAVAMLGAYGAELWWGYFLACPLGAVAAALLWRVQHSEEGTEAVELEEAQDANQDGVELADVATIA